MLRFPTIALAGVCAGLLILASTASAADGVTALGTFKDWHAYSYSEKGKPVCYMASRPKKSEGNYKSRDEVYLMITQRPGESAKDVVSFIAGYQLKPGSDVSLSIADKTFKLFTSADSAFGRDSATDQAVATAMKSGSSIVIKGVSARGTETKDTFSLAGSAAAHQATLDACK